MRKYLLIFLLLPTISFAQILGLGKKLYQYKASNGITYRIGDTIKLGQGSAPDGTFRYVQYGGWMAFMSTGKSGSDSHNFERNGSGYGAIVKKIHSFKGHGIEKVVFAVGFGGVNNFDLWIEDAITSCEIVDCTGHPNQLTQFQVGPDKFDQLKKLKELLDSKAISQAEYDEQKKKLLKQ
jgi:hypothetical protein